MKKCLFIILTFIFASGAYAQQLKLIGGLNISNYSHEWPSEGIWAVSSGLLRSPFRNSKIGFLGGFGIEFALNKTISLELEGFYFQKRSSYEYGWLYTVTEEFNRQKRNSLNLYRVPKLQIAVITQKNRRIQSGKGLFITGVTSGNPGAPG